MKQTKSSCFRLKKLSEKLEVFHVMVDDVKAVDLLKEHPLSHDRKWNVWVKVDAGYGRGEYKGVGKASKYNEIAGKKMASTGTEI